MTIKEAIKNIDIVSSNARMTRPEHEALLASIKLVSDTCNEVEELKQEIKKLKEK
jgi:hypothetical protein